MNHNGKDREIYEFKTTTNTRVQGKGGQLLTAECWVQTAKCGGSTRSEKTAFGRLN